jgi:group II intron reverse transcriptase/maturase
MTENNIYSELYERAKRGDTFKNLMQIVTSRENILRAYRNIKNNTGSTTAGTDKLTINDIKNLTVDEVVGKVRYALNGTKHGYRPKPIRRKYIPKPNGDLRPLGIPCIWDRLIQQCFKQVLEPICEAKFSKHSYGFRPNKSTQNAIADVTLRMNLGHLYFVIEFDIKKFFDNVKHSKLIRQMWTLGIRDKQLLYNIRQILKTPIKGKGQLIYPEKGTPQGGIISPLLANIVLNELDHWIENNWEENPIIKKYKDKEDKGHAYRAMRKTKLKEMYIVRYADDFRIFCRTKTAAEKTRIAVTQWLQERLKLEVLPEKTRVVNIKKKYSEFLGFKIKVHPKGKKLVTESHITDKKIKAVTQKLKKQIKHVQRPRPKFNPAEEIWQYNLMVRGIQNYYQIATHISIDCQKIGRAVNTVIKNRLDVSRAGRKLTKAEKARYGKSKQLRYIADEPLYPIGYVQHKIPKGKTTSEYPTEAGKINIKLLYQPLYGRSIEYVDNRISLYNAQKGKCAVTGKDFETTEEIHCHHIKPRNQGGTDEYENLILVTETVHKLIHATRSETISKYLKDCETNIEKLNNLRKQAGNEILS